MNYKKIIVLSFIAFVPMLFADFTYKKSTGSHPGSTGAPGESTCAASGCHDDGVVISNDTAVNSIVFPTIDSSYVPGQTYLVKLKVKSPGIQRFGFEILALKDSDNKNIGTWTTTQALRTQIITHTVSSDIRYSVTHKYAGTPAAPLGENEWEFNWTAPASNVGNITFYYATNSTNNQADNDGDQIRTSTFKLKPYSAASINEALNNKEWAVFYNQSGYFEMQYYLTHDEKVFISIIDASGKKVFDNAGENKPKGFITDKITLNTAVSKGIYFVTLAVGNKKSTKKINIIR